MILQGSKVCRNVFPVRTISCVPLHVAHRALSFACVCMFSCFFKFLLAKRKSFNLSFYIFSFCIACIPFLQTASFSTN